MDTLTAPPSSITAGDTVHWRRSLPDYPAGDGWSLVYGFVTRGGGFTVASDADGDDHDITVSADTTLSWSAGDYVWQCVAEIDGERYTVDSGVMRVLPSILAAAWNGGWAGDTQARRILAALRDAYENYVANGSGHVSQYEIAGRKMQFRSAAEILQQINYWQAQVTSEEQAASVAAGRRPGRVLVRFSQ